LRKQRQHGKKDTPHYLSIKLLTMLLKRYVIQSIKHGCWAMDDLSNKLKRKPEDGHRPNAKGVIGNQSDIEQEKKIIDSDPTSCCIS